MAIRIEHGSVETIAGLAASAGQAEARKIQQQSAMRAAEFVASQKADEERQLRAIANQKAMTEYDAQIDLARMKFQKQSNLEDEIRNNEWSKEKIRLSQELDFQRDEQRRQTKIKEFEAGLDVIDNMSYLSNADKERLRDSLFLSKVSDFHLPFGFDAKDGTSNLFQSLGETTAPQTSTTESPQQITGINQQTGRPVYTTLPTGAVVQNNDILGINPIAQQIQPQNGDIPRANGLKSEISNLSAPMSVLDTILKFAKVQRLKKQLKELGGDTKKKDEIVQRRQLPRLRITP